MNIKYLNELSNLNILLEYATLYQNKYNSYEDLSPYGWNARESKYSDYANKIVKQLRNICHISEYIDHDGCSSNSFDSNLYSLYIITKNNNIYTYYLYEFEIWIGQNNEYEYKLYNKKDSKILYKTKNFFYKTL